MAQLFDIKRVTVGPRALTAEVAVAPSGPLMTSDDPAGTERVLALMPGLADHVCLGDSSSSFGEVVASTEIAHLLEHVTVELLAQTNIAGDISSGQTSQVGERSYEITLACPDDVLVTGALSSAAWILQWAYSGGGEPQPDVAATVKGLVALVQGLTEPEAAQGVAEAVSEEAVPESEAQEPVPAGDSVEQQLPLEFVSEPEAAPEPEQPAMEAESESAVEPVAADVPSDPEPAAPDTWDRDDIPRPHLVR